MRPRALLATCCVLAAGGCGFGAGEERGGGAEVRVTRDFGHEERALERTGSVREGDTIMRFLQSRRDVETRFGGGFVQAIDGLEGKGPDGGSDWFFFVNGIVSDSGASERKLSPGDVIQWDFHSWRATQHVPAIVGAFPEPFVHGRDGKRLPVRVECAEPKGDPCRDVRKSLDAEGVPAAGSTLGTTAGDEVLRVVVGRWEDVKVVQAAQALGRGPRRSGVYARVRDDAIELLDADGRAERDAAPGTGLVAATSLNGRSIIWIVTGLDDDGVARAASAFDEKSLRNAFAIAVEPGGAPLKLPLIEGRE